MMVYHNSDPNVRIKVTPKLITWEQNQFVDFDDVKKGKEWKFYMRHKLPVNNAEVLQTMYNLPIEVVAISLNVIFL